jgi:hypothetical protein
MAVLFVSQDVWLQKRSSQVLSQLLARSPIWRAYIPNNRRMLSWERRLEESLKVRHLVLNLSTHENIEKARLTGAPCFVVDPSGSVGFDAPPPT